MDMSRYRELFISETREHLQSLTQTVIAMEGETPDRDAIDTLFRMAHSIKGMASTMEFRDTAELAHRMEDLMDKVRSGEFNFNPAIADLLLEGCDRIEQFLVDLDANGNGSLEAADLIQRLVTYRPDVTSPAPSQPADPDTAPPPSQVAEITTPPKGAAEPERTVRVKTGVLDRLINLTGELLTAKQRLLSISTPLSSPPLDLALNDLSKLLRELQNEAQKVRLLPFSVVADRFARTVRDLARNTGKDVALEIAGKDTEIDRGLLDELADPLVHILRNAVDHGIELPEQRAAAGKEARGRIAISVQRDKDQVIITIEDDGKGMRPEELLSTALAKGLIPPDSAQRMTTGEILMLCCLPGLSTARQVTDVSGRGVGMDAVNAAIREIGGALAIESTLGRGSRFMLKLPLTISIVHILLISSANVTFGIPITKVLRTLELKRSQIIEQGKRRIFMLGEEEIPLLSLNRILRLPLQKHSDSFLPVIISELRGRKVGLAVDRFIGQQEVYIKPLGRPLAKLKGIGGGTILGNGEVILLLDTNNLI